MKQMSKLRFLLAGAAVFGCIAHVQAGVLSDEVDRFDGTRTIAWRTLPDGPNDFAFWAAIGIPESKAGRFYMAHLFTYGDRQFASCNETRWLLDGRRAPEIRTTYRVDRAGSNTIEYFDLADPRSMLPIIAAAKKVEFQVCTVEGRIKDADLDGIRQMLKAANP
ncbi:hypothetical protein [Pseudomonas nitroreducens]|nr:hypothetical protein [Pseudomonas nitroreducens]